MKQVLSPIAALVLIAAIAAGCGQREQTTMVDGYTVVTAGGATFAPTKISNDGETTTVQLQAPYRGQQPAIFVMSSEDGVDTVRYRWDGSRSRFVVDGRFKRAVLALVDKRVTITRN